MHQTPAAPRLFESFPRRLAIVAVVLVGVACASTARDFFADGDTETPVQQASVRSTSAARVAQLEQSAAAHPGDGRVLGDLAAAYLQRARETGDPSFYTLADTAVQRAQAIAPDDVQALVVAGGLALSRHNFAAALELGERARDLAPGVVASYAVITDALVELGRYDEAAAAAQQLADLRPDFAALSRISYVRELHGDLDGAVAAMQQAVDAGSGVKQDAVWGLVLLGNLELQRGDVDAAERPYRRAAAILPDDPQARFGLSKLETARGDFDAAERDLRFAIDRRPAPEYVIALGDLLASEGRVAEAEQQYALVRAEQQLFAANGGDADLELALFDADHGADPAAAYGKALAAYGRRPSVTAADVVAWTAYRAGRIEDARAYSVLAMRLGSRDPRFAYHAGMIALAAGDVDDARGYLSSAVAGAASLSPLDAAAARDALASLGAR